MVNVRRGINIRTSFAIQRNGVPEDLSQAQNLRVVIRHKSLPNSSAAFTGSAVSVLGNSLSVVVTDTMQKTMASGVYLIEVAYRLINPLAPEGYDPYIIDSDVFTLTDRSSDVGGVSCGDVTVQVVNISGEVSFCSQALEQLIDEAIAAVQAANEAAQAANEAAQAANDAADAAMAIVDSKINIDGLNANVKRLQFDTTAPTAPTAAGQIAWSDDEHTLVFNDGLHTHPLGKELELRARNTSGATILNGRACYVTGSTGDNPTIGPATTTNPDVAQKPIGVATMDIANNAFGIVTTFGEVNDIDTSGLTLGAIVYLGATGTLTTTEPVAPTPKIVIGICVRQHAQVGKLFVSTRPIARLSKLSDVFAPTLTENDVLRYNGTTLRWEVYSLAGKADLVAGKVPTSQLPSYVDDVLEYATLAAFPATGETGKIYVALNTNLTYRWSGTAYVEISKSLALGETADTAYRGDRGKTAYDHSQAAGNPHSTTAAQIQNTPAGTVAATTVQAAINELDADRVQLETDLNKTDIKNAEQDASIRSIEQLLSQSNMNQTAQVSSTGREIISLPKTASNGGMEVKLEGLTAQNLVANGDFRDGTTGWAPTFFNLTSINNTLIATSSKITTGVIVTDTQFPTVVGEKVYVVASIKTIDSGVTSVDIITRGTTSETNGTVVVKYIQSPVVNNTYLLNGIATLSASASGNLRIVIRLTIASIGAVIHINKVMAVNLTATFGAGKEPDLATCDAMFSTYFDATKSFIPTGRIRSIGKNFFNGKLEYGTILSSDGADSPSSLVLRSKFIQVKPNSRYQFSDSLNLIDNLYYYGINKKLISEVSRSVFNSNNTPTQCFYVRFRTNTNDINYNRNIQLEQNSVSTSFVSYRDSKLYITAPELKSNGIVKDEIRKGANGYEFVKRISEIDGTALNTPTITPIEYSGILNSAESGTVFHEPIVADACVYGVNLTVLNTTYPISSLEELMVHTNVDTYLDVSKAAIASDGLSFTHPDLRAGDLVLFTYFFSKEKVNGLITAMYYDGRYVIADTANGKFYKWGVKSTNGVATIQLTEV